ncbi:hypothetical protein DV735_g4494, partial [Chaetothyriales sp. CBS 134920]
MAAALLALLPASEGYLPLYVLLVGVTAVTNAISSYQTSAYVERLYAGPSSSVPVPGAVLTTRTTTTTIIEDRLDSGVQADRRPSVVSLASGGPDNVTPLSARTFATWNMAVGITRLFAAYHIHEPAWFQMQMITNIIGLVHFGAEAFVFKTATPSGPWLAPVIVASIGLVWSIAQYSFYVR